MGAERVLVEKMGEGGTKARPYDLREGKGLVALKMGRSRSKRGKNLSFKKGV